MADTDTGIASTADADTDTSLALTGVYSGLRIEAAGSSGTLATASSVSARAGYKITTLTDSEERPYTQVTVDGEKDVTDPPALVLTADYAQQIEIPEVDLDVRYTDIPQGTSLEVTSTEATFHISRQQISGTGLIGSSGKNLEAFSMSLEARLWITDPDQIRPTSAVTLSLSKIQGGSGKPVKKVLLQKLALKLSN